jgi:hypothetical protein
MADEKPKVKRALTQKYDMAQLHALTNMEDGFLKELAAIYSIEDPDDLPVSVDLLKIFQEKATDRASHLASELSGAPQSCDALIARIIGEMEALDAAK